MFNAIPAPMKKRMEYLEEADFQDRANGTPRMQRLRQITPETGQFIAIMLATAPEGEALEIGTSGGYSTLWLALACKEAHRHITTFELLDEKVRIARETFREAGVEDVVRLVQGDARHYAGKCSDVAFCFIDCEKEAYADCYEAIIPAMVRGGILVADNAISHGDELAPFLTRALKDERVDAMILPVGKGVLLGRKK